MLNKCLKANEVKLSLGVALESYRLDLVESILQDQIKTMKNKL